MKLTILYEKKLENYSFVIDFCGRLVKTFAAHKSFRLCTYKTGILLHRNYVKNYTFVKNKLGALA